jgi:hypothetical protein
MEARWLQCLSINAAPLSASKLSEKTNSSRETIVRFMRVLSAHRVVDENGPEEYSANSITHWLTTPAALAGAQHLFPQTAEACLRLPSWFTNRQFAEPTSLEDGPFFATFQKTFWDSLRDDPAKHAAFSLSMEGVYEEDVIKSDARFIGQSLQRAGTLNDPDQVLLVDIGGGTGHLLRTFRDIHSGLPGKLVLQDRASVIQTADPKAIGGIDLIAHDFFDAQPVKCKSSPLGIALRLIILIFVLTFRCKGILASTCSA